MARTRIHDVNGILDAAEELLAGGDPSALTIRALAERTGAPSGSLYHAFKSRSELLGRLWLRAAKMFLDRQRADVRAALAQPGSRRRNAVAATVAAASTLAELSRERPNTARLLMTQRRDSLIDSKLSTALADELRDLDKELSAIIRELSIALWERRDRAAMETVAACVVDLPAALLPPRRPRKIDPVPLLAAAVRGVLAQPPAPG